MTHSIPSHAALHAISRACDLAMARPFGHAQRVARAALHLGRALSLPDPLLADLLIAALCHAAGAVAVAGDLGRVLQRDERPTLRHHPAELAFALLDHAPDPSDDSQDRTGIFLRHYTILERFPAWTRAWLHRIGLPRAGEIALGIFDGLHRAGQEPGVRAASAALGAAYHLVALRWLGAGPAPPDPRAATLRGGAAWIDALAGARFPTQVAQEARALWEDDDAWRDLDDAPAAPTPDGDDPILSGYLSTPDEPAWPQLQAEIDALLAPHLGAALSLADPRLEGWLSLLGVMVDRKTCFEEGHSARVANLSGELALLLGADDEGLRCARLAASLYGVGRLALPSAALESAAPLDDAGQALLRQTPAALRGVLAPLAPLAHLVEVALAQGERLDGSGRPLGLRGAQIPLGARILAVVDTFEALIAERPYRPAYARARALHILQAQSGRLFDGVVTDTLEGIARGQL